jgi:hypothetical protein
MISDKQLNILKAKLDQIKIENPNVRERIRKLIISSHNGSEQKEITRRLRIQNRKLLEQVVSLKEKLKKNHMAKAKVADRLNHLTKINNSLSEALGSCSKCWGEDPNCTVCMGNGVPGWNNVNRRFFNVYILPSMTRVYELTKKGK